MKNLLFILTLIFGYIPAQQKTSSASPNVRIISENFKVPQLNTTRRIWIYLPPDYHLNKKKFPVMYLQDGQNLFDEKTSYSGEWQVDESMNTIFSATKKSAIIVGIDNGGEKRISELSPFTNEKYGVGDGDKYVNFITETLKPYIDKNYRTKGDRRNTFIGGSSLGALISVYAAAKHPEIFSEVLGLSPAFWFNADALNDYIKNEKFSLKNQKYYFVQGKNEDKDIDEQTLRVIESLKSKGVKAKNIYFRSDEDGKHNEIYWRREFPAAIKWILN